MNRFREKCLNSYWFFFLTAWLFWEPDFIKQQVPWLDKIFDAGNIIVLALLALFFVMHFKKMISIYDAVLAAFGAALIISTLLYSGVSPDLWKCLKYEWPVAAMALMIRQGSQTAPGKMIRALYHMYYINVVVNFAVFLFFRDGLYTEIDHQGQYWLGNKNVFIVSMLAGLCCGYLDVLRRGKKITADYALLHLICIIQVCWMWSVTSIVGIICYTIMLLLANIVNARWFYSLKLYIAFWISAFFYFTVFRLHKKTLRWLIKGVFHKSVTLTKRTKLWRRLLKRFRARPVFGYGVLSPENFHAMIKYSNKAWVHAHNYILELLIKGGIVAFGLFLTLLLTVSRELKKMIHAMPARVISITLLSYFVIFSGDCFEMRTPFYVILTLGYMCSFLCDKEAVVMTGQNQRGADHE